MHQRSDEVNLKSIEGISFRTLVEELKSVVKEMDELEKRVILKLIEFLPHVVNQDFKFFVMDKLHDFSRRICCLK